MRIKAESPEQYIKGLSDDRKTAVMKLRKIILDNLPEGFVEIMNYGMIGYVIPHSVYPGGYHTDPGQPLPFMNIASQKNHIALYHMGLYADNELMAWFKNEYPKHSKGKLDMGKSCIRFKKVDQIPFDLIGKLTGKMTSGKWIEIYKASRGITKTNEV